MVRSVLPIPERNSPEPRRLAPVPTVLVETAPRPCPVVIEPTLLARLGPALAEHFAPRRVLLVTDAVAGSLFGEFAIQSLAGAGFTVRPVTLWGGEGAKTLATIDELHGQCATAGLGRDGGIVALGGGTVSDVAGFAAATWKRGIDWAVVPTTLLAQVDAAIGGKTGVNRPEGKNLVGAFHQPAVVLIDPELLRPLPARQLASGLAEVVKSAVIGDPTLFERLETRADAVRGADVPLLTDLVARAVAVKARLVAADPREAGVRAHLNLGHTLGHAIEAATGFGPVTHGEAVALGCVAAARIAVARGLCDAALPGRLRALCGRLGLPVAPPPGLDAAALRAALGSDKKAAAGRVRWVLPRAIGVVEVHADQGEADDPLRWLRDEG